MSNMQMWLFHSGHKEVSQLHQAPWSPSGKGLNGLEVGRQVSVSLFSQTWFFNFSKWGTLFSSETAEQTNVGSTGTLPRLGHRLSYCTVSHLHPFLSWDTWIPPDPAIHRFSSGALLGRTGVANGWDGKGSAQTAASPSLLLWQIGSASSHSLRGWGTGRWHTKGFFQRDHSTEILPINTDTMHISTMRSLKIRFHIWESQNLKTLSEYSVLHSGHLTAHKICQWILHGQTHCTVSHSPCQPLHLSALQMLGNPFCIASYALTLVYCG